MSYSRFYTLDALRGVAAICVLFFHAIRIGVDHSSFFSQNGFLAVDFFFQLSGFVVAFAYEEKLRTGSMGLADFAAARFIRLYPMIFMGAVIGGTVFFTSNTLSISGARDVVLAFLCLPRLSWEGLFPVNGPFWSLFFELFANAVFAVAVAFAAGRRTLIATLLLSLAALCAAAFYFGSFDFGWRRQNFLAGFPRVGFSFALGVAIYHATRIIPIPKTHPSLWIVILFGALAWPWGARAYSLFCIAGLFPTIILFASNSKPRGLLLWTAEKLGDLSYPLYATHFPLLPVALFVGKLFGVDGTAAYLILSCAVLIGLGFAFARFWDAPIRVALRKRLYERQVKRLQPQLG
ncbi:MAG: acyltransferase [Rhodomicrobium sp.]